MTRDDGKSNGEHTPKIPAKDTLRAPLPKRFYKTAAVAPRDGGFAIQLDGRGIRTPGKRELTVPVEALAEAIADEWRAQGEHIDPATMPLTRIVNSAIDAVEERKREVADDIDRSAIREQVEMGVAVRMACLDVLTRPLRSNAEA